MTDGQQKAYWLPVDAELRVGTPGEIDEDALRQKKALLSSCFSATSRRRLERYGAASFAATAAEYIHTQPLARRHHPLRSGFPAGAATEPSTTPPQTP